MNNNPSDTKPYTLPGMAIPLADFMFGLVTRDAARLQAKTPEEREERKKDMDAFVAEHTPTP